MDFPSRDQPRILSKLQAEAAEKEAAAAELEKTQPIDVSDKPFRVDKRGWEDDFWSRTPNVFTVAIDRAPLVQPPGSAYRYSNPAIVVLA